MCVESKNHLYSIEIQVVLFIIRDPGRIRTCDPQLRRLLLYPTELRDHTVFAAAKIQIIVEMQKTCFDSIKKGGQCRLFVCSAWFSNGFC